MVTFLIAACILLVQAQQTGVSDRRLAEFVPIGVRYQPAADPARRRADLETIRQLRFNVVASRDESGDLRVTPIDELLRRDAVPLPLTSRELSLVPVTPATHVRERAWWALARGARGIIFDDWVTMQGDEPMLAEAAAFADAIARNPELYVPLRPADKTGGRVLTIAAAKAGVEAEWLESSRALLLIAVNQADEPREVTLMFSPEMPEAIWQNMLSGAAVNFVAAPKGPEYSHTFAPHGVLVLMIRKGWR